MTCLSPPIILLYHVRRKTVLFSIAYPGNQISLSALNVDEWITSPNNNYRAVMQGDGNFVVYAKNGSSEIVKWATYTQGGNYYTYRAAMQEDGNFVIYGISSSGNHTALWTSNTAIGIKSGYIYKLILTNEGTLKVVSYSASNNINKTVWSSSSELFVGSFSNGGSLDSGDSISSQNKNYFATMQVDGNFVVYLRNGTQHVPLWYTSTQGESFSSYKAFMQQDGNFVIYGINSNGTHQALWSSGTAIGAQSGYSYKLCITDDGNLQIIKYNLSNQSNYSVIWSNNNKISLNVVNFKQYDSRWKDTYIGNSNAKIGKVGCLVTSIAMLYNYETKNSNVYPYNIDEILGLTFSSTGSLNSYTPLTNQGYGTIRYNNGNGVLITQDMMKLIYNKWIGYTK